MLGMTETRLGEVREILAGLLADIFGEAARFGPIYMDFDWDEDGFDYVKAHVIYESPDEWLDPEKLVDVLEPLNDRMLEIGVDAIPVVSYIAKSEEQEWLDGAPAD